MKIPFRKRTGTFACFVALQGIAALVGCRYVLGITDRIEGENDSLDSGGPDADTGTTNSVLDAAAPKCLGPGCIPTSCRSDGGAEAGPDAAPAGTGDRSCGPEGKEDCCAVAEIDGGAFLANNCGVAEGCDGGLTTVAPFRLDIYEVTVGRFRRFVEEGYGTAEKPPPRSEGQIPGLLSSGWDERWDTNLTKDTVQFTTTLAECTQTYGTYGQLATAPMTCATWFEAFAFCIYDGGRLPTEAEWSFAASGGNEQRPYPWGSADPDPGDGGTSAYANYCENGTFDGGAGGDITTDRFRCSDTNGVERVGNYSPTGDGRFGNADLGGSAFEWVFDYWRIKPFPCDSCAIFAPGNGPGESERVLRGGSWRAAVSSLRNSARFKLRPASGRAAEPALIGFRCARDYPR